MQSNIVQKELKQKQKYYKILLKYLFFIHFLNVTNRINQIHVIRFKIILVTAKIVATKVDGSILVASLHASLLQIWQYATYGFSLIAGCLQ